MEMGKRQQHIYGTESEIQLNNDGKTGIAIAWAYNRTLERQEQKTDSVPAQEFQLEHQDTKTKHTRLSTKDQSARA